ncbi:MAG: DUF368 domain-containing protein [Bacilli bacterium]|nr:DUF368 domain-containing protein [Bacilli bacterium]
MTKKIKDYIVNFFNGFAMALADSVPGVSGGTIAFLLGFYDQFINSLNYLLTKNSNHRKSGLRFLGKIGIGWVIGMIASILILTSVFETHIYKVSSLFMGFIILSIPIIISEEKEVLKGKYLNIIFTIIGILLVFLISYYNTSKVDLINITSFNFSTGIYIFLVGMIAISAMILPGISGSTLLLIFGLYLPIINGIKNLINFDFSSFWGLFIFGLGVLTGMFSIIKLLKKALNKFRTQTVYTIIGLMIGSIYSIIMGPTTLEIPVDPINIHNFNILFFLIGGLIVWGLQQAKKINEKK